MKCSVELNINKQVLKDIQELPDVVVFEIARKTLDLSFEKIPKKSGKMRASSMNGGVRGQNGDYYIGSYTDYANRVWSLPEDSNWSEPGTNNKWFERTLKEKTKIIVDEAINIAQKEKLK